ncbi:MAG: DUF2235 domain-containing protein, partial [Nanoarchaeales archaeon]|nr:DUF2235 domain-containing protein [Nanoarchaeales archaeon]
MSRNIILTFDGTSQNLHGQEPSSVGNIHQNLSKSETQLTRYTRGIAKFHKNKSLGLLFGANIDKLIVTPTLDYFNEIGLQ